MENSLFVTLLLTLIYAIQDYYQIDYHKKINPVVTLLIPSWVWFFLSGIASNTVILSVCIAVVIITLLCQIFLYINESKQKNKENNNIGTVVVNNINELNGKTGIIKAHLKEKAYLGTLDDNETSIIIYMQGEINKGDKFIITGIEGSNIIANKVIKE